ncbi:MAG: precorrin-2 C(20)-methyltransferase [Oscillospiraceae bacterium]
MNGKLYGIGTGPGDPELMTLKAVRIINDCEVIAAPRTSGKNTAALNIASQVCDMSRKEIIYMDFSMGGADADELHQKAADNICKALSEGKNAAFLTIGDITVYSTFSYIARIVESRGYETELCPGVTGFCASASAAKRSLTEKDSPLVVIPSSCAEIGSLLDIRGTKVIMKSGRKITKVRRLLEEKGMIDSTYAVCNCGMADQRIYDDIAELPDDCGYFTTIITEDIPHE